MAPGKSLAKSAKAPAPRRHAATVRRAPAPAAVTPDVRAQLGIVSKDETAVATAETPAARGALAGSALSPQTWKQTLESLREMTAR